MYMNIDSANETAYDVGQGALVVGTTNVTVSDPSFSRQMWYITNTSLGGQIISIKLGQLAVNLEGFVLNPGQVISESQEQNYRVFKGTINVISSAAGGTIAFVER